MCGEIFSIYDIHIPRKCIESMQFYSCLGALVKTAGRIFWKSVSFPQDERGGRNYVALSKFDQKIRRRLRTLVYLYFVWFVIFLNKMALQVCE